MTPIKGVPDSTTIPHVFPHEPPTTGFDVGSLPPSPVSGRAPSVPGGARSPCAPRDCTKNGPANGAVSAGGLVSRVLSRTRTRSLRLRAWSSIWDVRRRTPRAVISEMVASRAGSLSLSDLAPGGVYLAAPVTRGTGALLPHRFTLTCPWQAVRRAKGTRSAFCCTCRRLTRPAVSWHPCSAVPGLSSRIDVAAEPRDQATHTATDDGSTTEPARRHSGRRAGHVSHRCPGRSRRCRPALRGLGRARSTGRGSR